MSKRSNLWCFVVYPESLPVNWLDIVNSWHIPCLISPVHDSDTNADDTEKKDHIHILIDFGSGQNKSFDQVKQFTDQLKGTIPIICHSRNAMIRYFIHKDNPEKFQYKESELLSVGGFEYQQAFENYTSEIEMYKFIENLIYDNIIYNYAVLVKYLNDNNLQYELLFVRKHSIHFNSILNGQWQLLKVGKQIMSDSNIKLVTAVKLEDVDKLE